jgi:hypothetical protein
VLGFPAIEIEKVRTSPKRAAVGLLVANNPFFASQRNYPKSWNNAVTGASFCCTAGVLLWQLPGPGAP